MRGWIGLCYNKSVLTITKLDNNNNNNNNYNNYNNYNKIPMATWDYGFGN